MSNVRIKSTCYFISYMGNIYTTKNTREYWIYDFFFHHAVNPNISSQNFVLSIYKYIY